GWQEWYDRPIPGADGVPLEIQAVGRDITERHRIQDALKESEARYRLLAELTSDYAYEGTVAPDGARNVRWVTYAEARPTGYSPAELAAMGSIEARILEEDLPAYQSYVDQLQRSEQSGFEFRLRHKDGSIRWQRVEARYVPHPTRQGWARV